MILSKIVEKLNLEQILKLNLDEDITDGYTSDLMSDVLANATDDSILITIQAHKNSVAAASMANVLAIFIANNRPIPEEMIAAAKNEEIAIFRSKDSQFTLSWKLHEILV